MPLDALPEGFKDQAVGTNTDWNNPIQKYWRKSWFAYGPRSNHWWAKWREMPKVIFAFRGPGMFRYENTDGSTEFIGVASGDRQYSIGYERYIMYFGQFYLSAIQYWCKWHVALLWPLHFQVSYYIDAAPMYPEQAGNRRVFYFRIGARRDADRVYWFPSVFLGLQWN